MRCYIRDPTIARQAHRQHGDYLEVTYDGSWNPADYAHHLSRRARGLPFWFSLATHGTKAYEEAIENTIDIAQKTAKLIEAHPKLELVVRTKFIHLCLPTNRLDARAIQRLE